MVSTSVHADKATGAPAEVATNQPSPICEKTKLLMQPTVHSTDPAGRDSAHSSPSSALHMRAGWSMHGHRSARTVTPISIGLLLTLIGALVVGVAFQPIVSKAQSCSPKKILFVGSTAPLEARDEPLRIYLFALGNEVTVRSAAAVQAADAAGKDLIIISESVESVQVNTKLRDVTVPIVTWEGWLQDDFKMTGPTTNVDYGENLRQQSIRIVNPDHPLAAGFTGVVTTVTNDRNKFQWGRPNGNATIVAVDVANGQNATIYAYEAGAAMVGLTAPARRIFIHNATGPNLSTAGWRLFDSAVTWAVGCSSPHPTATPTLLATTFPTLTPTATATQAPIGTATPTVGATQTPTSTPPPGLTPTRTPTATKTPIPTNTPRPARLTLQKQDYLFVDANEDGLASQGDTLLYAIELHSGDSRTLTAVTIEDAPDVHSVLLAGTVRTDAGTVITGNQPGDRTVVVDVGTMTEKQTIKVLLQVQIQFTGNPTQISNQAQVRYTLEEPGGQGQIASDDPDTSADNDSTITPLGNPINQGPQRLYLPLVAK